MKTLPPGLSDHLASGATTLSHCWRVTTRDGAALGFTDHDRDLAFDGTLFEAQAGFTAGEIESTLGLAADNLEAAGALSSSRLDAERLRAGDFDDAAVEIWRVNWQDTSQRVLMRRGHLGDVRHDGAAFAAEIRGLAQRLDQPQGRLFQFGCDAALGDHRCRMDLSQPDFAGTGEVVAAESRRRFTVSGLDAYDAGWFARGHLVWTEGANLGRVAEVKFHRTGGAAATIELWERAPFDVAAGDRFDIRAGCDKQFSTCVAKFANASNYRGFPHMPGNDFVSSYATRAKDKDRGPGFPAIGSGT